MTGLSPWAARLFFTAETLRRREENARANPEGGLARRPAAGRALSAISFQLPAWAASLARPLFTAETLRRGEENARSHPEGAEGAESAEGWRRLRAGLPAPHYQMATEADADGFCGGGGVKRGFGYWPPMNANKRRWKPTESRMSCGPLPRGRGSVGQRVKV
jgi:hypothetical protein